MAWIAIDENKKEYIYEYKPLRDFNYNSFKSYNDRDYIQLPQGTIQKIIGRVLTWEDEPIEI